MFSNDIDVIRAVHADRISRDVDRARAASEQASADRARLARQRNDMTDVAPRATPFRVVRRSIGRSIVRIGARIAAETSDGWSQLRPDDSAFGPALRAAPPTSVGDC